MSRARLLARLATTLILAISASVAAADPVKIYAAGSLVAPLKELIAASGMAGSVADPTFGPSGLLRQRIAGSEKADLFLSADMGAPTALAGSDTNRFVIPFARNTLCVLSRAGSGLTDGNLLDRLLDPNFRLATSTPVADPGGDYAWAVFDRADAVRPGASATLKAKALKLMGAPNTMTPIAGKTVPATIFLSDKADALLYYCSGQADTLRDVPTLESRRLPPALDLPATYGMGVLSNTPDADRFALFVLSDRGQAILAKHGLLPVLETPPGHAQSGR